MESQSPNNDPTEYPIAPEVTPGAPLLTYAIPLAYQANAAGVSAWQEGRLLVVRKGAFICDRCIKCGQPTDGKVRKQSLYWHDPLYYLLLLAGLVLYFLVTIFVRETGTVHYGLCPAHSRRRLIAMLSAWTLGVGGIVLMCSGAMIAPRRGPAAQILGIMILVGVVALVAGLITALVIPFLRAKKIDPYYMWLKGASPSFLATLPDISANQPIR